MLLKALANASIQARSLSQGICAVRGEDVLQTLGIDGINIMLYAFILLIITVVYRILFYIVLKLAASLSISLSKHNLHTP